jgi:hypothetical protein
MRTPDKWSPEDVDALVERRDRLAEEWLLGRHAHDWYIGNATRDEWVAAYEAVDLLLNDGADDAR